MKKTYSILAIVSIAVLSFTLAVASLSTPKQEVYAWCMSYDMDNNLYYLCKDERSEMCSATVNGTYMQCIGKLYVEKGLEEVIVTPEHPVDPVPTN